jgi:hypothetical protein
MENTEGVTTPPETAILESLAEILRANGYTVTRFTTQKPAKLRDRDGDIWYLTANGRYSMYRDRTDAHWTLEQLQDPKHGLTPLTGVPE